MSEGTKTYKAIHKFARISPRKARLLADLIRNKKVNDALTLLKFNNRRGAYLVNKVLESAVANATSQNAEADDLKVSTVFVDEGPTIKRWRPRAMGRATPIMKRTSHIHVELS